MFRSIGTPLISMQDNKELEVFLVQHRSCKDFVVPDGNQDFEKEQDIHTNQQRFLSKAHVLFFPFPLIHKKLGERLKKKHHDLLWEKKDWKERGKNKKRQKEKKGRKGTEKKKLPEKKKNEERVWREKKRKDLKNILREILSMEMKKEIW
eukprot:CAMPEP_0201524756 /NCGR_PEP_ID=MMETSP0161_2-20130828/25000_1 /ASSEMBLY_ACC=CAM_ASM_000251 /TAXON_ID=180227 /ORGANISM="Neoparamoeba aestuarina, Strain SoJaBio B1-5/56/2" /LENGTH=149 /DNA_ID=CAMNT_0047924319 /DNA_START=267 /DNA_END=714 /DNA_ORIENTATION=-